MAQRYSVATLKKQGMKKVFAPEKTDKTNCWKINSSFYDIYFAVFNSKKEANAYYERIK